MNFSFGIKNTVSIFPAIFLFCCIGIYSINSLPTDVMFIAFFGLVGYGLIKLGFEPAFLGAADFDRFIAKDDEIIARLMNQLGLKK